MHEHQRTGNAFSFNSDKLLFQKCNGLAVCFGMFSHEVFVRTGRKAETISETLFYCHYKWMWRTWMMSDANSRIKLLSKLDRPFHLRPRFDAVRSMPCACQQSLTCMHVGFLSDIRKTSCRNCRHRRRRFKDSFWVLSLCDIKPTLSMEMSLDGNNSNK